MSAKEEQISLFDIIDTSEASEEDKKYTMEVSIPQYLPNRVCPIVSSLINSAKYRELLEKINTSSVSEEEKNFLRLSATRHIVFNYSLIADYYAHASKEMQQLMEDSALVIIDFNDAIANSYVKLSKRMKEIMTTSGRFASNDYANQKRTRK